MRKRVKDGPNYAEVERTGGGDQRGVNSTHMGTSLNSPTPTTPAPLTSEEVGLFPLSDGQKRRLQEVK